MLLTVRASHAGRPRARHRHPLACATKRPSAKSAGVTLRLPVCTPPHRLLAGPELPGTRFDQTQDPGASTEAGAIDGPPIPAPCPRSGSPPSDGERITASTTIIKTLS